MSPPITYKTVTATYTAPDGSAVAGQVRFIPSATVLDSVGYVVVPPVPITATLTAGVLSVELACTDVAGTTPQDWYWQVSELFAGGRETTFQLPSSSPSTVHLADLLPADSTDVTYQYASYAEIAALDSRVLAAEATVTSAQASAAASAADAADSAASAVLADNYTNRVLMGAF